MKTLILLFMILISPLAYSQISQRHKPVLCSPLPELLNNLKTNYGEKLEFLVTNQVYNDFLTKIVMYRNKETGSWTIIEYSDDPVFHGEGCILGSGRDKNS